MGGALVITVVVHGNLGVVIIVVIGSIVVIAVWYLGKVVKYGCQCCGLVSLSNVIHGDNVEGCGIVVQ